MRAPILIFRLALAAALAAAAPLSAAAANRSTLQQQANGVLGGCPANQPKCVTPAQTNSLIQTILASVPTLFDSANWQAPNFFLASQPLNAGVNLGVGVAPAYPVDGDLWLTKLGLYARVNGSTVGPLAPAPPVVQFATHAALLAGANPLVASTLVQWGFYATGDGGWAEYDFASVSTATANGVTVILPAGQSSSTPGRYLLRIPATGVHPEAGGAYCDQSTGPVTGHDDSAAINNLIAYISNSATGAGEVVQTGGKSSGCYFGTDNLVMRQGVGLTGVGAPITIGSASTHNFVPFIVIDPARSVVMSQSSSLHNMLIFRANLPNAPATNEAVAFYQNTTLMDSSIAISAINTKDVTLENIQVVGFNKCIYLNNAPRFVLRHIHVDCGTGVEITGTGDVSVADYIHDNQPWTAPWNNHISLYAAQPVTGTGTLYQVGDLLTMTGGACPTAPQLAVASIDGAGAPTAYTVADAGDCTGSKTNGFGSPEGWSASATSTVVKGGTGGTDGTNVQITPTTGLDCDTPPVLLGTISGGILTAITGVYTPGFCHFNNQPIPNATVASPDGLLIGASILYQGVKTAVSTAGGHGSGAQITISTQGSGYRPGSGIYVHDRCDGCVFHDNEFEGYQTSVKVANVGLNRWYYYGGEGNQANADHNTVGLDLEGCVKDSYFYDGYTGSQTIDYLLNVTTAGCTLFLQASPTLVGMTVPVTPGLTQAGILTGPGSAGTITLPTIDTSQVAGPTTLNIGPGSGQWNIGQINWGKGSDPLNFNLWITVDPSAAPPLSPAYAPPSLGGGDLLINGNFLIDQMNEGASGVTNTLRADRWRAGGNLTANVTSQRLLNCPGLPRAEVYSGCLKFTVATPATPTSGQQAVVINSIEAPDIGEFNWGSVQAQPAEVEIDMASSLTGNFDLILASATHGTSMIHRCNVASANVYVKCAFVAPEPLIGSWAQNPGTVGIQLQVDLGAGSNFQTSTAPDTWQLPGACVTYCGEITGDVQLVKTSGATLTIAAVHLRYGPFSTQYQPRPIAAERGMAQRYFQKSMPQGTAAAQNAGSAGAVAINTPFTSGAVSMPVRFGVPMAVASPTITVANTSASNGNCRDATSGADVGAGSAINVGSGGFVLQCSLATAPNAVGDLIQAGFWADSGI